MSDETYNGWTNYETWLVNLWLTNDEGSYDVVRETVEAAWSEPVKKIMSSHDPRRVDVVDAVKALVEDWAGVGDRSEDLGTRLVGFQADLLGAALSEVDWFELAECYITDFVKPVDAL